MRRDVYEGKRVTLVVPRSARSRRMPRPGYHSAQTAGHARRRRGSGRRGRVPLAHLASILRSAETPRWASTTRFPPADAGTVFSESPARATQSRSSTWP